jgi:hypothetical protein
MPFGTKGSFALVGVSYHPQRYLNFWDKYVEESETRDQKNRKKENLRQAQNIESPYSILKHD